MTAAVKGRSRRPFFEGEESMRTIIIICAALALSGCDNPSPSDRHLTVKDGAALEDKVDAIGRDKHKIYVCADQNETYSGFRSCLRR